jgi:fumarylacetoacetase
LGASEGYSRARNRPLGPPNGKSFITSSSPWVVTLDALKTFAVPARVNDPSVAPYLEDPDPKGTYAIELLAEILATRTATQAFVAKTE